MGIYPGKSSISDVGTYWNIYMDLKGISTSTSKKSVNINHKVVLFGLDV